MEWRTKLRKTRLKEDLEEFTLRDVHNRESVYIVPMVMYTDEEKNLWLNGNAPFYKEPQGGATLKVSIENGKITVDAMLCKQKNWPLQGDKTDLRSFTPLPVFKIINS